MTVCRPACLCAPGSDALRGGDSFTAPKNDCSELRQGNSIDATIPSPSALANISIITFGTVQFWVPQAAAQGDCNPTFLGSPEWQLATPGKPEARH